MKAVVVSRFGGPEVLAVEEQAEPRPGPGEITIAVRYAGVGFVDTLFRSGHFRFLAPPFTPGIEVAGDVLEIGEDVTGLEPGQGVAALLNDFFRGGRAGGYAEVAAARADLVTPLPAEMDPADAAALLANGVTAWIALTDVARLAPSDTVVVLGVSGGVGGQAARIARASGAARVIGIVGSPERAELATVNGCDEVLVAGDGAGPDPLAPDVVFDPVGGDLRRRLIGRLAPFGRYVVVGNASGDDIEVSTDGLWHASATVTGFSLGGIAHLRPGLVRDAMAAVLDRQAKGELGELTHTVLDMAEAATAHRWLAERSGPGKVVLAVRP